MIFRILLETELWGKRGTQIRILKSMITQKCMCVYMHMLNNFIQYIIFTCVCISYKLWNECIFRSSLSYLAAAYSHLFHIPFSLRKSSYSKWVCCWRTFKNKKRTNISQAPIGARHYNIPLIRQSVELKASGATLVGRERSEQIGHMDLVLFLWMLTLEFYLRTQWAKDGHI